MFIKINDTNIWYQEFGSGFPLICLHGGMGIDSSYLLPLARSLANEDLRVILYDQRGHGKSSYSNFEQYSHRQWTEDLRALAKALGFERFALLGHSYGGFIALEFALAYPQMLSRLILVGTSAGPIRMIAPRPRNDDDVKDFFLKRWDHFFTGTNKFWNVFKELTFSKDPFESAFHHELITYDLREQIVQIKLPVSLIVGSDDHYINDMRWLARTLMFGDLHVIPETGHFPFLEKPYQFNEILMTSLI